VRAAAGGGTQTCCPALQKLLSYLQLIPFLNPLATPCTLTVMRGFHAGSIFGIPITVQPGWFVMFGLVSGFLGFQVYPDLLEDRSWPVYAVMAAVSGLVFLASILVHEIGHALVARRFGIPVKDVSVFLLGGRTNMTRLPASPWQEMAISGIGPLVNLAIGTLLLGGLLVVKPDDAGPVDATVFWVGATNIVLGLFNLLPAYPMDGGKILRAIVWRISGKPLRATRVAAWTGRGFAWAMIAAGTLAALGYDVVLVRAGADAVFLIFIGMFLESSARQGLFQGRIMELLDRYRADQLMSADPPVVSGSMSVSSLARGVLEINSRVCYFVEDDGRLAGILSAIQIQAIPEANWDTTTAAQAMVPRARLFPMGPERSITDVLLEMEHRDVTHLPVVSEDRVLGVVGRDRILLLLRQHGFLGGRI
jgi:Zn-dependent protease